MKIQLNTDEKTITLENNVQLSELVKCLEKLLPKDSPFGYWKDYSLHCNTVINNWNYPVYIRTYDPIPWWHQPSLPIITCVSGGQYTAGNPVLSVTSGGFAGVGSARSIINMEVSDAD